VRYEYSQPKVARIVHHVHSDRRRQRGIVWKSFHVSIYDHPGLG
jgi:hypothetical protein